MPLLRRLTLLLLSTTAVAAVVAGSASAHLVARAATVTLNGSVGPGFVISLTDASGARVTSLPPGEYAIVVNDQSAFHNFHLTGPGVDRATAVGESGTVTWMVTLQPGRYTFVCDPHAADLTGSFQVTGTPVTTSTTTTTTSVTTPAPPTPSVKTLAGSVGPGFTIALGTGGKRATSLKAGRYALTVSDRSAVHNFVLVKSGGGSARSLTSIAFVGTKRTTVNLTKGKWEYYCAPHRGSMRGSFTVG